MLAILQKTKEALLDTFFPAFCMGCKKEGRYLCKGCSIFFSESELICPVCKKESGTGETHEACKDTGLDGLSCLWEYEGLCKRMISEAKEKGISHAFKEMTDNALFSLAQDERFVPFLRFLMREDVVLTFVPMERRKERRRGFNQARIIAEHFGGAIGKPVIPLLEREEAVSFAGNETYQSAILVDDVWETGSTMKKYALLLKESGIKTLWGFALGRFPYVFLPRYSAERI